MSKNSKKIPERNEVPIHKWDAGLKLYRNKGSDEIRNACKRLLEQIKDEKNKGGKSPSQFEKSLIDWCIWKYTTCDFVFASRGGIPANQDEDELPMGDKYAARYYSKKAWHILNEAKNKSSSAIRGLRFDHVWERKDLRDKICNSEDSKIVFEEFAGCVVTKKEHDKLTKPSKTGKRKGWNRYEGQVIYHYCDKKKTYCKCRVKNGVFVDCEPIQ